ncbi:leucine-rich repeat domain-containing protein [Flammeovirga yaeyamensis]|uniref:Leucine-rich repeat domain-containing protein n=1 Tax=Flammeovirga yaeyamensis TaxID=367791 RepID=A0AAX1N5V9_9BACT|nr:leucine-rich repeat domain-containing protein [Flammeovirga yaeyamensis]MBB3697531.1 Leucine-rich repeat (LRR) protein [Flammeovirga yaeyamensis]NMF36225.1 hypothetical protein [Flammeovirga yaeyamensis]QWG02954.1 leucine-rich repeat domain-containing protein [Flammeovirga yaeyamensis]
MKKLHISLLFLPFILISSFAIGQSDYRKAHYVISHSKNNFFKGSEANIAKANSETESLSLALNKNQDVPLKVYTLTNLKALRISSMYNTSLPRVTNLSKISSLDKLQHLSLKKLQVARFPDEIIISNKLKTLQISTRKVNLDYIPDLSKTNIHYLSISLFDDAKPLPLTKNFKTIFETRTIEELDLFEAKFKDEDLIGLKNLENLKYLNISRSNLNSINFIGHNKQLKELKIVESGVTEIGSEIGALNNLTYLSLSNNDIQKIAPELYDLTNLVTLNLSYSKNLESVSNDIKKLQNLQYLNLRGSKITEIPAGVFELKNLIELDLSNTNITSIPEDILKLEKLEVLRISSKEPQALIIDAKLLSQLKNLKQVQVASTSKVEKDIKKQAKKLKKLRPEISI